MRGEGWRIEQTSEKNGGLLMMEWIVSWPTWGMARVLGILAYMAIFLGLALGRIYRYPIIKGKWKAQLYRWHTRVINGGSLLALLHAAILLIDSYSPYRWRDVLIPFASSRHSVLSGIGTIAAYGLLALLLTSDYRHKIQKQLWLAIHLLSCVRFTASGWAPTAGSPP